MLWDCTVLIGIWRDSSEPKLLSYPNPCFEIRESIHTEATSFTHFKLRLSLHTFRALGFRPVIHGKLGLLVVILAQLVVNPSPMKEFSLWSAARVQNSKSRMEDSVVQWQNIDWCWSSWFHLSSCVIFAEWFNLVEVQILHLGKREKKCLFQKKNNG